MKTRIPTEIVKVLAGHLRESNSPEQEKLFAEWLAVPGNDAEYRKFLKVWNEIVDAETPDFDVNSAWQELNRRLAAERGTSLFSSRFVRIAAGIAAAAAVAVVSIFSYDIYESYGDKPVTFASVSGKSRVCLPDGSDVVLNAGASVTYGKHFGEKDRNVLAEGRVFFDVAKDKKKPFIIQTGGLEIKVLGTKFDVDSRLDEVIVSLVEGSVSLTGTEEGKECIMKAGEVAVFDKKSGEVRIGKGDVRGSMLWCMERLSFQDATLDKVCHDLSMWYGVNVVLADNLVGKGCINFTITDESLESVLSIISATTGVNYRFESPKSAIVY